MLLTHSSDGVELDGNENNHLAGTTCFARTLDKVCGTAYFKMDEMDSKEHVTGSRAS